jgi:methionyl-tRNA formyltransferase
LKVKTNTTIKTIYMGSPEFAIPALKALAKDEAYEVSLVISQPDKPRGRGKKLAPTPVKSTALDLGLNVETPDNIKETGYSDRIAKTYFGGDRPDIIIVCAYGKILPEEILSLPKYGCINLHASLLPKFRGAAPIHRAIEAGEKQTGITLMKMDSGLDTGDMIQRAYIEIGDMNAGELTAALSDLGACLLLAELPSIISGQASYEKQDNSAATYANMLTKEDGHIDFCQGSDKIISQVNAMTPAPGAYAFLGTEKVKIIKARRANKTDMEIDANCQNKQNNYDNLSGDGYGRILRTIPDGILVCSKDGAVVITHIGMPNKKPMSVADYLRGNPPLTGVFS